jgi:hypothetical protein
MLMKAAGSFETLVNIYQTTMKCYYMLLDVALPAEVANEM